MRYVLAPDAALRVGADRMRPAAGIGLLAPARLRSDLLAALYAEVRAGRLDRREAFARLDHLRALGPRLLGDRVLLRTAWEMAEALDLPDTGPAEYPALTRLQADALIVLDPGAAALFAALVPVADLSALRAS